MTEYIANFIISLSNNIIFDQCINLLKSKAVNIINCEVKNVLNSANSTIKRMKNGIIFPFNKEIHPLAKFEDLLCFNILDYFDTRYGGLVGTKICDSNKYIQNNKIIKNYELIDWNDDFDTVILGHVEELIKFIRWVIIQQFILMEIVQ